MRLPTEAEWEYAARGGSAAGRYGPLDQSLGTMATVGTTHEVGQKQANGYGLYDMLGNVWEWVADWYQRYDAAPAVDPKGPAEGTFRMLRGGRGPVLLPSSASRSVSGASPAIAIQHLRRPVC